MLSLERVLRWAPGSRWRLESALPPALQGLLQGHYPLFDACLASRWEMRSAALSPAHAELHFRGSNATELALKLRYAADGSLDGELEMARDGIAHSLQRGGLAVMLGGKHEAYLCERKDGSTRMLLRLEYASGVSGPARCSAFGEALRSRVPEYFQGLLPQEIALLAITPLESA